jgi:hypothetical protein
MTHVAQQRRRAISVGHNLVRESPDFTTGWEQIHFPKCDGFFSTWRANFTKQIIPNIRNKREIKRVRRRNEERKNVRKQSYLHRKIILNYSVDRISGPEEQKGVSSILESLL